MCKWCNNIPRPDNLYSEGVSGYIYYSDGYFYTNCGDSYYDMAINYCPNCGKKLELSMVANTPSPKAKGHRVPVGNNVTTWSQLAKYLKEWT